MNRIGFWLDIKAYNIEYYDIQYVAGRTIILFYVNIILYNIQLTVPNIFAGLRIDHDNWFLYSNQSYRFYTLDQYCPTCRNDDRNFAFIHIQIFHRQTRSKYWAEKKSSGKITLPTILSYGNGLLRSKSSKKVTGKRAMNFQICDHLMKGV